MKRVGLLAMVAGTAGVVALALSGSDLLAVPLGVVVVAGLSLCLGLPGRAWSRFLAEVVVGLAVALGLTVLVMLALFRFGPWADPPGMDALHAVLSAVAIAAASWRAWRRSPASGGHPGVGAGEFFSPAGGFEKG
ncbi:hypothetical protein [Propioniciclava soli]|uniref:Uncharacterized protein n=1 Tax=Propioniciclava soli TaxID=2775081 RepID=A0ABZ3CAK9_9ACTN|nr:hypothetical protein [Propioniciclava soli]